MASENGSQAQPYRRTKIRVTIYGKIKGRKNSFIYYPISKYQILHLLTVYFFGDIINAIKYLTCEIWDLKYQKIRRKKWALKTSGNSY